MLILVLAANTSFADFPRLASFHAGDNFMPRQLTKRGHRLVFSNGIIFLAATAIVLLIVTDAKVDRLIPLYAIGVFTSFTLSQAGMAKHHIREKEPGWRWGLFVNGMGAILSFVVDIVIAVTKFRHGAWVIVVLVPVLVVFLVRLAKQYEREDSALEHDVPQAVAAPVRKRLVVMVFVDRLDLAVARAMQFGRTLRPDELRAVHFAVDDQAAKKLAGEWREHGLANLALDIVDCPDRRLSRAPRSRPSPASSARATRRSACSCPSACTTASGTGSSTTRPPSRSPVRSRGCPHANVTTVPFHFDDRTVPAAPANGDRPSPAGGKVRSPKVTRAAVRVDGTTSIGTVRWRQHVRVAGRIQALRVHPLAGSPSLECTIADDTGAIAAVFLGRHEIGGLEIGRSVVVEGMVVEHHGRLSIVNPLYELLTPAS